MLDGVEVERALRWMPGVGFYRAQRLARGLPTMARIGELTAIQHHELVERVANHERDRLARTIGGHCAATDQE